VGKVSKAKKRRKLGGGEENKVPKKTEIRGK